MIDLEELKERARAILHVAAGQPLIWRAHVKWEDNNVIRIRSIDPTATLLVRSCVFWREPDTDNPTFIKFGDEIATKEGE